MTYNISTPPKGFNLEYTVNGYPLIKYRTTGMTDLKIFFAIWLTIWTFACVIFTIRAFMAPEGIDVVLLLILIPFWAAEFFAIGGVIWHFGSIMSFEFGDGKLTVSRNCLNYKRKREVFKSNIIKVRQVKDGGESGEESFDSWGIVIEADKKYKILHCQPIDKSEWLGRTIGEWAQKEYKPWQGESKDFELI